MLEDADPVAQLSYATVLVPGYYVDFNLPLTVIGLGVAVDLMFDGSGLSGITVGLGAGFGASVHVYVPTVSSTPWDIRR